MKIDEFLIETGKYAAGAFVAGAIGACAGYTFGTISRGNPYLTAQVIAIAAIAAFVFRQCVEIGFEESSRANRDNIYILAYSLAGATLTIALRNLEIISIIGTIVISGLTVAANSLAIYAHTKSEYLYA